MRSRKVEPPNEEATGFDFLDLELGMIARSLTASDEVASRGNGRYERYESANRCLVVVERHQRREAAVAIVVTQRVLGKL